jgi:hypothetical protein
MPAKLKPQSPPSTTAVLMLNLFGGDRQPLPKKFKPLIRISDGYQKRLLAKYISGPNIRFPDLPFSDGLADNMTVLVCLDACYDAGFFPVKISPLRITDLDLILVPKPGRFEFDAWEVVQEKHPYICSFLACGSNSDQAKQKYEDLRTNQAKHLLLAALLNLTVAMSQIHLPRGTPLDYFKQIEWGELERDRFFAYADNALVDQVRMGTDQKLFAPEPSPKSFHKGATSSFKQIEFGEANVQLTFHENNKKRIGGTDCVIVEPDIDYYKDLGAHGLLEVIPNTLGHQLTDPRQVYILRWIAGQRGGLPPFDPPYRIV